MPRLLFVAILFSLLDGDFALAQWGTLRGRIVLDGEVPVIKPLVVGPAKGVAAGVVIADDSLIIDPKSKGIANVAVWLVKKPEKIHPALVKPALATVEFNNTNHRYEPHVLFVRTDQKIRIINRDPVAHNTRSSPLKNQSFGEIVAPNNQIVEKHFKVAERLPIPVACDIHPWERAYWLVLDHPYAAITDSDGYFEIPQLPVGEREFKVWHERAGYLVKNATDPKKGLIVTIEEGEPIAVPDIHVPVKTLTEPRK